MCYNVSILDITVEIQKVFLDWWEPGSGDLFSNNSVSSYAIDCIHFIMDGEIIVDQRGTDNKKEDVIPLLTEGQIREFIEDSTDGKVDITFDIYEGGYTFEI